MVWLYIILFYIVITFCAGIALYVWNNYHNRPTFGECIIIGTFSVLLPIGLTLICVVGSIFVVIDALLNFGKK